MQEVVVFVEVAEVVVVAVAGLVGSGVATAVVEAVESGRRVAGVAAAAAVPHQRQNSRVLAEAGPQ